MFQFKFENIKAFLFLVFFSKLFFDDPNIKGKLVNRTLYGTEQSHLSSKQSFST